MVKKSSTKANVFSLDSTIFFSDSLVLPLPPTLRLTHIMPLALWRPLSAVEQLHTHTHTQKLIIFWPTVARLSKPSIYELNCIQLVCEREYRSKMYVYSPQPFNTFRKFILPKSLSFRNTFGRCSENKMLTDFQARSPKDYQIFIIRRMEGVGGGDGSCWMRNE